MVEIAYCLIIEEDEEEEEQIYIYIRKLEIMIKIDRVYTKKDVARFRKHGDVINGVAFDWYLAGPKGASFTLIDEGQSDEQFTVAEDDLHISRDVIGAIKLARVE